MNRIAALLKTHREARKMSQQEMAKLLDMSLRNYNRMEGGKISIYFGIVSRICKALNITPNQLINGK